MKMIDDWKAALTHYSTVALAVATALQGFLAGLPQEALAFQIPGTNFVLGQLLVASTILVGVLGLIGKFVKQPPSAP